LRIRGKFHNIIISAYAPTEDKDEALKEQFYEDLQKLQDKVPRSDLLIIAGDFNAKVGSESAYKGVVGKCSIHPISNLNGEYLCNHATSTNLFPAHSSNIKQYTSEHGLVQTAKR
jgi:hypothetical protein